MRLYYFLDECEAGAHSSHWDAFARLQKEGSLTTFKVCSFKVQEEQCSWRETLERAKHEILAFAPDRIILAHTGRRHFPADFFSVIRKQLPTVKFIYDERDVHGIISKRIPVQTLMAAEKCDIVYLVAEGWYASIYRAFGCKNVRYLPQVTDDLRFGKNYGKIPGEDFDVVMIGNHVSSRFINMPGVNFRSELTGALSNRYGKRFGLFGNGWKQNKSWQGTSKYQDQERIIQGAICNIGSDHFPSYTKYFSDRLPIALYSGRPHLSFATPGVHQYLSNIPNLYSFQNTADALDQIDKMIANPNIFLHPHKTSITRSFIENNLLEVIRQRKMLKIN